MKIIVFINAVLNTRMYLNTYLNTNVFKYCPALHTDIRAVILLTGNFNLSWKLEITYSLVIWNMNHIMT